MTHLQRGVVSVFIGAETCLDGLKVLLGLFVSLDGRGMLLLHGLERGLILLRFGFFVRRRLFVSSDVLLQIRFAFLLGF